MRPRANTGSKNEPPRLMVSLIEVVRRETSFTRSLPMGRSVVPRVVSMQMVSKCPDGNWAPSRVR